jgi:hypothetical protein
MKLRSGRSLSDPSLHTSNTITHYIHNDRNASVMSMLYNRVSAFNDTQILYMVENARSIIELYYNLNYYFDDIVLNRNDLSIFRNKALHYKNILDNSLTNLNIRGHDRTIIHLTMEELDKFISRAKLYL